MALSRGSNRRPISGKQDPLKNAINIYLIWNRTKVVFKSGCIRNLVQTLLTMWLKYCASIETKRGERPFDLPSSTHTLYLQECVYVWWLVRNDRLKLPVCLFHPNKDEAYAQAEKPTFSQGNRPMHRNTYEHANMQQAFHTLIHSWPGLPWDALK